MISSTRYFLFSATVLAFMAVLSGTAWTTISLAPEVGGQEIALSGYQLEPLISSLPVLQFLLISLLRFFPGLAKRVGLIVPAVVSFALAAIALTSVLSQYSDQIANEISKLTGISGASSQLAIIISVEIAFSPWLFLVAAALLFSWSAYAVFAGISLPTSRGSEQVQEPIDLWSSQR